MIRTQVYLPKQLYQTIDVVAKQEQKPKAEVIRELLKEGLLKKTQKNAGDALLQLAQFGKKLHVKGPADLSTKIDSYLYKE